MLDLNPAKVGVDNPVRRLMEQHPFESWEELDRLAEAIGLRCGLPVCPCYRRSRGPCEVVTTLSCGLEPEIQPRDMRNLLTLNAVNPVTLQSLVRFAR